MNIITSIEQQKKNEKAVGSFAIALSMDRNIIPALGRVQVLREKKIKDEHRTSHKKMTGFSREFLSLFCLTSRKNVHSLMGLGKSDRIFQGTFTNKQISFS